MRTYGLPDYRGAAGLVGPLSVIVGSSGTIGGWTMAASQLSSGNIKLCPPRPPEGIIRLHTCGEWHSAQQDDLCEQARALLEVQIQYTPDEIRERLSMRRA